MRTIRLTGIAVLLAVVLTVSFLASPSSEKAMANREAGSEVSTLFSEIERLWSVSSLTPPHVEEVTGIRLTGTTKSAPPPATMIFVGSAARGMFSSAELRMPADPTAPGAGLLILRIRPQSALTAEQVVKRYGGATDIEPPHPGSPPDTPVYYRYTGRNGQGVLSFGIKDDRVVSVVIDRYPE